MNVIVLTLNTAQLFDLAKWKASVNKPSNAIVKGVHSQSPVDPTLQTSSVSLVQHCHHF